ncbi:MAG: CheR family methyltransferase [Burkholderiaceae bacterium]|jgi:two-component system CheB/CheR fusion protein
MPTNSAPTIPVAGIGASAGGIEALLKFFGAVRADLDLAYVVIIHLAPDRKSDLPQILARATRMPVTQVGDDEHVALEANHVYVIAPDRKLEIGDTWVGSSPFDRPRGQRAEVDLFFRSLVARHTDGFAIILSGSGSDGALGAKAVKEAGGVVLVQDPREAAHTGMPRSAIATGAGDAVLRIDALVARLAELVERRRSVLPLVSEPGLEPRFDGDTDAAFRQILELLGTETGHDFSKYKKNTIARRITRRMQLGHQENLQEYYTGLRADKQELAALFGDLLISVTAFFRDPAAWEALRVEVVNPVIDQTRIDEQIRVWVPACATGEEAYSIAILFHEELARRATPRSLVIFATDIDEAALSQAREGLFSHAIVNDLSEVRLGRFFQVQDDHYRIARELRDCVVFANHSVLRDPPFSRLHLISCRNLLIYLDREVQEQCINIFQYALVEKGDLFLGASESAEGELFHSTDKKHRIFQSRVRSEPRRSLFPELLASSRGSRLPLVPDNRQDDKLLAAEAHSELLERYAPPSVLVDEHWNVVHLSASAAQYLQQGSGPLARRLVALVRPELRDEMHALLQRAFEKPGPHLTAFVEVALEGAPHRVVLYAQQRSACEADKPQALVVFLDVGDGSAPGPSVDKPSDALIKSLREQLRQSDRRIERMRDEHFLTNEDLRAANEELQSLNEEYRSTAEELETSKEELQSINEELQTVNHELKTKLEEVSSAHSDIENLMAATDVAILFLSQDLHIKRFTPRLTKIFNVKQRDVDRPIQDVTHNLDYTALKEDAQRVLDTSESIQKDSGSSHGRAYIIRLGPYRSAGSTEVSGVVATFMDITSLKRAEAIIEQGRNELAGEVELFRRLHAITTVMSRAATLNEALDELLEAAIEFHGADFGNIQLSDGANERLIIAAQRGFDSLFLEAFHQITPSDSAASARVLRTLSACRIEDVAKDPEYAPYLPIAKKAGYRAVQSIPLISRSGTLVGVLSTHFRKVRKFTERDDQLSDMIARQVADLIANRADQENLSRLNRVLEKRTADLAAQAINKENFLAELGHELRNPLAAIQNSIEVMHSPNPPLERALSIMRRQAEHMAHLLNDLLDITRINHGKVQLNRATLDLRSCLEEVIEAVRPDIDAKRLTLTIHVPKDPVLADVDRERIHQVLDNLMRNAIAYTESGGITALLNAHGPGAVIAVRDTGIGVDPADADVVFEPFQSRRGSHAGGLGLGLALVKRIVELHGGAVHLRSAGHGTGSEFTVALPLATAKTAQASADGPKKVLPALAIMVVDDQPDNAEMFAALLGSLGQTVETATSAKEALEKVRQQSFDLVFLDLSMPEMDGAELARELRKTLLGKQTRLVALTGFAKDHPAARRADFDSYLVKPASAKAVTSLFTELYP